MVPSTIKQYGAVSLAPILREVNEELLAGLHRHGFDKEALAAIRVNVFTCQSLPLTSTLNNVMRHMPTPQEVQARWDAGLSAGERVGSILELVKFKAAAVFEDREMKGMVRKATEKMRTFIINGWTMDGVTDDQNMGLKTPPCLAFGRYDRLATGLLGASILQPSTEEDMNVEQLLERSVRLLDGDKGSVRPPIGCSYWVKQLDHLHKSPTGAMPLVV